MTTYHKLNRRSQDKLLDRVRDALVLDELPEKNRREIILKRRELDNEKNKLLKNFLDEKDIVMPPRKVAKKKVIRRRPISYEPVIRRRSPKETLIIKEEKASIKAEEQAIKYAIKECEVEVRKARETIKTCLANKKGLRAEKAKLLRRKRALARK